MSMDSLRFSMFVPIENITARNWFDAQKRGDDRSFLYEIEMADDLEITRKKENGICFYRPDSKKEEEDVIKSSNKIEGLLLEKEDPFFGCPGSKKEDDDDQSHVTLEKGKNYLIRSSNTIEDLSLTGKVGKFSIFDITWCSDRNIHSLKDLRMIYTASSTDSVVIVNSIKNGEGFKFVEDNTCSPDGLQGITQNLWKYYNRGIMGWVRHIFSSIVNFFRKYKDNYKSSDWPGNNYDYINKIITQMQFGNKVMIALAAKINKKIILDYLEVPFTERKNITIKDITKLGRKKSLRDHPDKNKDPEKRADHVERYGNFMKIYRDFSDLQNFLELNYQGATAEELIEEISAELGLEFPESDFDQLIAQNSENSSPIASIS